ncbi:MAG: hypothetical protein N4A62_14885 [Marinisporobacter sp.]|jgi:hypothetical protein|nr:hypothetical protein [Marinisporobacter sp.]
MEEKIILIIALLNIFISYFLRSNPNISKSRKYVSKGLFSLGVLLILYTMVENIYDIIYIFLIFSIFMGLGHIYDERVKESKSDMKIPFNNFFIWIFMFFMMKKINTYLIDPIPHHMWMMIIGFQSAIRWIHCGNKSEKLGLLCMCSNFLAVVGLFILFSYYAEPMKGISKQEVVVKKYLIQHEKYKEDDIDELERMSSDKKQLRVFVKIKEKYYIYYYKQGKIEKIEEL